MTNGDRIADVLAEMDRREERDFRLRQMSATKVINVRGMVMEVNAHGYPDSDRDSATLRAMAETEAQRELTRRTAVENRGRKPHACKPVPDANEEQISAAYFALLREGRHRAKTGNSLEAEGDLSDALGSAG